MTYPVHEGDLPDNIVLKGDVAVDTETTGLHLGRDRLCLVQLCDANGNCHLVKFAPGQYTAPNLAALLSDQNRTILFHFARFDLAMIERYLGLRLSRVYCTRTASKLVRTYTDRHGLKDLCRELIAVDISKAQQSSDWASESLSDDQVMYAANDVLHLHALRQRLDVMLEREGRMELAQSCFDFLPVRAALDLAGWEEQDIFAH